MFGTHSHPQPSRERRRGVARRETAKILRRFFPCSGNENLLRYRPNFCPGLPAFRIITCTAPTATSAVALASLSCSPRIARLNARNQSANGHFQPLQINCHKPFTHGSPIIPVSGKPSLEMSRSPSRETFDTAHRCISFCRRLHDKRCARPIHSLQEIRSGRSNISEILQRVGEYSWRENY